MNVKVISAILVLAVTSMACGFSVNLPGQNRVGPEVEDSISISDPKSDETRVSLSFGAGELNLSSGAKNLVDGTALYNVADLKPEVTEDGAEIEIKQGDFEGIPPFDGMRNEWNLQLGSAPMDLVIEAGAYEGTLDLGGLSLKSLTVNDGAANVELSFNQPNLVDMSQFTYTTGASEVKMDGLANANFKTFVFNGGAGDYTLDFSGDLQRDATVSIDSGLSDLTLIIPQGVNAVVTIDSALADINFDDGWSQSGQVYTQEGDGPTLTIVINMGAGNVVIRN
jgi:hypothetical protein